MEMKFCAACGMPLSSPDLVGLKTHAMVFCIHCVDENKTVRSGKDIFEGGVQFFMQQLGPDRRLAEKITRKNMKMQGYWQGKEEACLCGEIASDEEFQAALAKLRH